MLVYAIFYKHFLYQCSVLRHSNICQCILLAERLGNIECHGALFECSQREVRDHWILSLMEDGSTFELLHSMKSHWLGTSKWLLCMNISITFLENQCIRCITIFQFFSFGKVHHDIWILFSERWIVISKICFQKQDVQGSTSDICGVSTMFRNAFLLCPITQIIIHIAERLTYFIDEEFQILFVYAVLY